VPVAQTVQSVAEVAPVLSATEPALQLLALQLMAASPADHEPGSQGVHPSLLDSAFCLVCRVPASHSIVVHEVAAPPSDYDPYVQSVQSVAEIAPVLEAIVPAGQVVGEHEVEFDSEDYVPGLHRTHCCPVNILPGAQFYTYPISIHINSIYVVIFIK
jgi:hypothetical protein